MLTRIVKTPSFRTSIKRSQKKRKNGQVARTSKRKVTILAKTMTSQLMTEEKQYKAIQTFYILTHLLTPLL